MADGRESIEEIRKDAHVTIDNVNADDVFNKDVRIILGGRVAKLEFIGEEGDIAEDIRSELKVRLSERLKSIKEFLDGKIQEIYEAGDVYNRKIEKKEQELNRRLAEANLMPPIGYDLASEGLSVVQGHPGYSEPDVFTWLYRGLYWPKFINGRRIDPKFTKKLISPIIIEVVTVGNKIRHVVVKQIFNLKKFSHYHSTGGSSDCWGEWRYSTKFESPKDILIICKEAESVLESINEYSLGDREPSDLPKFQTLTRHLVDEKDEHKYEATKTDLRMGINPKKEEKKATSDGWTL